jgi:hypothetical protein
MLDHLVQFSPEVTSSGNFKPLSRVGVDELLDAQTATADWLDDLGVESDETVNAQVETTNARDAFKAAATAQPPEAQKAQLMQLKTPAAVRHLTGMLTAYDWEFVEQAKELRGYAVAKILEEVENPNANIRLKALGLLGKVTEIGLFTEKIEVKQAEASDAEIEQRIKDKLNRFMGVVDVIDVTTEEPDEPEKPDNAD